MKGRQAPRKTAILVDHEFASRLDRHILKNPENVKNLKRLFKTKANETDPESKKHTKKILEYFRDNDIITDKIYQDIRAFWVSCKDESGKYGKVVKKARKGFLKACKMWDGGDRLIPDTRFEVEANEFDVVSRRAGNVVEIRIKVPKLGKKSVLYKLTRETDPTIGKHLEAVAERVEALVPSDEEVRKERARVEAAEEKARKKKSAAKKKAAKKKAAKKKAGKKKAGKKKTGKKKARREAR
jgi:hypothetical protein